MAHMTVLHLDETLGLGSWLLVPEQPSSIRGSNWEVKRDGSFLCISKKEDIVTSSLPSMKLHQHVSNIFQF